MKRLLLILGIVAATARPALAIDASPVVRAYDLGTLLNAVALNGAPATRTFTVGPTLGADKLWSYSTLVLRLDYTWANNGTISVTCTEGATGATATSSLTVCSSVISGECFLDYAGKETTPTLTASKKVTLKLGIAGSQALSCVVTHNGTPNGSDVATVTGVLLGSGV